MENVIVTGDGEKLARTSLHVEIQPDKYDYVVVKVPTRKVSDPSELVVGREYWLVPKPSEEWPNPNHLAKRSMCQQYHGKVYFESHIWTHDGNNQGMRCWDIYGPLPSLDYQFTPAD